MMHRMLWIVLALGVGVTIAYAGDDEAESPKKELHVGDTAPDFAACTLDGKDTLALRQLLKRKHEPIVLVFGSYT